MNGLLNTVLQPWFLVAFGIAGFVFFFTIGKMSRKP
jgi:hypothetical protein